MLTAEFARLVGNESLAVRLEEKEEGVRTRARARARAEHGTSEDDGGEGEDCVAAIVGTDVAPEENLFVVGDAFLKSWYATFNYVDADAGGGPSVSFAQAV